MLACVDRGSRTLRALEEAGRFGVNVLEAGTRRARRSASPASSRSRRSGSGVGWSERSGIPILDAAIVWIGCELRDVISGGDHVIVTGEVLDVAERAGRPADLPRGRVPAAPLTPAAPALGEDDDLAGQFVEQPGDVVGVEAGRRPSPSAATTIRS